MPEFMTVIAKCVFNHILIFFNKALVKLLNRKWGKRMTDEPPKSELVKKDKPESRFFKALLETMDRKQKNRELNHDNKEGGKDFREWLEKQDKAVLKKYSTINDKED